MPKMYWNIKSITTILWTLGLTTTLAEQYTKELDLERENRELKQQIQMVKDEMDSKFNQIISMIQQNPNLAKIKPEVLQNKLKF